MLDQANPLDSFNKALAWIVREPAQCVNFIKENLLLHQIASFPDHQAACWYTFELLRAVPSDEQKVEVVNIEDENGENALFEAVKAGNMRLVQLLHESGADINGQKNHEEETTLVVACRDSNKELIEYLIENDAAQDALDDKGNMLAGVATIANRGDILEFFETKYPSLVKENAYDPDCDRYHPIHRAAEVLNTDLVDFWLRQGISINFECNGSGSPLDWVYRILYFGEKDSLEVLIMMKHLMQKGGKLILSLRKTYCDDISKAVLNNNLSVMFLFQKNLHSTKPTEIQGRRHVNHHRDKSLGLSKTLNHIKFK